MTGEGKAQGQGHRQMHMRRMVHITMNMRREQVKHVNATITTWTVRQP